MVLMWQVQAREHCIHAAKGGIEADKMAALKNTTLSGAQLPSDHEAQKLLQEPHCDDA